MFLAEVSNVVITGRTNRALRLVSSVIVHFGEQFLVNAVCFSPYEGEEGLAFQPSGLLDVQQLANRGIEVHLRHHGVAYFPAPKTTGASHHQVDGGAVYRKVALHTWKGNS